MGWMHGNHIVFKTAEANWLATQWWVPGWVHRDFAVIMILYDNTSTVNSVYSQSPRIIPVILFVFYQEDIEYVLSH